MKNLFIPDFIYRDIYQIDYRALKQQNIKLLIFDIDNTLVPYSVSSPDKSLEAHFEKIKTEGFKVCFFSNNTADRVEKFNRKLNYPAYADAKKPLKKNLKRLLNNLGIKRSEAAIIGDQIFTDILAANRMGIISILVPPLGPDTTKIFKFKRKMEKYFIKKYHRNHN